MHEEPPSDLEPSTPVEPPRPKRMVWAWLVLWALVGLVVSSQLDDYFKRGAREVGFNEDKFDSALKMDLLEEQLLNRLGSSGTSKSNKGDKPGASGSSGRKDLAEKLRELDEHRFKGPEAAAYWVVLNHELGNKLDPEMGRDLSRSKSERHQLIRDLYYDRSISKQTETKVLETFKTRSVFDRLVRIHLRERQGDTTARGKEFTLGASVTQAGVFGAFCCILPFGVILLFVYLGFEFSGRFASAQHPALPMDMALADRFVWRGTLIFCGQILIVGLIVLALSRVGIPSDGPGSILGFCGLLLFTYVLFKANLDRMGITFRQIGIRFDQLGKDFLWGAGAFLANIPVVMVTAIAGTTLLKHLPEPEHPISNEIANAPNGISLFAIFFMGAICAPILEEISFRGLITPALQARLGRPWVAIFVNGLIFAAVHPTGIPAWPALAAIGIVAARITYIQQSLMPAIFMHMLHNAALLTMSIVMLRS